MLHSPFQSVDGPVHGPLALLLVPDGQEVQRAPRKAPEQREQGHAGADLKQEYFAVADLKQSYEIT